MQMNNEDRKENQIIKRLEYYCATQERCKQDVLSKIKLWGLKEENKFMILEKLINEDFINESRYVKLFCRSKFRLNKWGRIKIKNELIKKNISKDIIKEGLHEIDEEEYLKLLNKLIKKKASLIGNKDKFSRKKKIAIYLIQKGFESEIIWPNLNLLDE